MAIHYLNGSKVLSAAADIAYIYSQSPSLLNEPHTHCYTNTFRKYTEQHHHMVISTMGKTANVGLIGPLDIQLLFPLCKYHRYTLGIPHTCAMPLKLSL